MPVVRHRPGLTADNVVRAAAEIADETSFANLTLGLVAGRLGVRAPSLYKHVDGLADLRHRVATLAMTEFGGDRQWSGDLDVSFEALIDFMDSGLRGLAGGLPPG